MMLDMSTKWWSGGVLFTHWCAFLCLAAAERDRTNQLAAASPEATPASEALSAILFSVLATEAFINELAEVAAYHAAERPGPDVPGAQALADLAATLDRIEKEHGQIEQKYLQASEILSGQAFPRGKAPFQEFAWLVKLRSDLVHPRNRDRTTPTGHMEPSSAAVRHLQRRGLTTSSGSDRDDAQADVSWLHEIETSGVASWAYGAAREIITALIEMFPDNRRFTIMDMMRRQLQLAPP
jgi:hypothetical protein